MSKKLRVGLLLDSYELPLWEYVLVERLITASYASINLVILNTNQKSGKGLLR